MKKIIFALLVAGLFSIGANAQNSSGSAIKIVPENFKSDGCSMFPDGCYKECCVEHDKAYFGGGSWSSRWKADRQLLKCVAKKKGWWHKPLAPLMWAGVRLGGAPFLPTPFRWGFGVKKSKNKTASAETTKKMKAESEAATNETTEKDARGKKKTDKKNGDAKPDAESKPEN